jgi:hypothetical protein
LTTTPKPTFDLTARVGCALSYEVTGTASLLLNLQPIPERNHAVVFQALTLGDNLPAHSFDDSHGNRVWQVKLAPGLNSIRHDAIVALRSRPDNADLPAATPVPPDELSASILLYAPGTEVLSVVLYDLQQNGQFREISALAFIQIAASVVLVLAAKWISGLDRTPQS